MDLKFSSRAALTIPVEMIHYGMTKTAQLAAFVASPLASATNGAALRIDGGVVRSIV